MRIKRNTKIRRFFKNIGFTLLLTILVKPISLLVESFAHSRVGNEDWATYASLFSFGFLFCALSDLGINQYLTKIIAEEPLNFKRIFPKFFTIKLFLMIIYPFAMVLAGILVGYEGEQLHYLFWLAFCNSIIQFSQFFRANLQGFQLFKQDAIASNLDKLFFIFFISTLLFINRESLATVVVARVASISLAVVAISLILIKNNSWISPTKINKRETINLLKKAFPFALISILYSVNERTDIVMIERIAPDRIEAGVYAASYRWLDAAMMYLWTILPLFFARFAFHKIKPVEKQELLKSGIGITAIPLLIIAIFSFFHSGILFTMFSESPLNEVVLMERCFQILALSLFFQGSFAILSTYLTSNGYTNQVSWSLVISIIINVLLNSLFIPKYGAIAAAYSTLASTCVLSLSYIYIFIKKQVFDLPWLTWGKIALVAVLTFSSTYLIESQLSNWVVTFLSISIISIILSLWLGIINLKSILKH